MEWETISFGAQLASSSGEVHWAFECYYRSFKNSVQRKGHRSNCMLWMRIQRIDGQTRVVTAMVMEWETISFAAQLTSSSLGRSSLAKLTHQKEVWGFLLSSILIDEFQPMMYKDFTWVPPRARPKGRPQVGELSSCSFSPLLPEIAYRILATMSKYYFRTQYEADNVNKDRYEICNSALCNLMFQIRFLYLMQGVSISELRWCGNSQKGLQPKNFRIVWKWAFFLIRRKNMAIFGQVLKMLRIHW